MKPTTKSVFPRPSTTSMARTRKHSGRMGMKEVTRANITPAVDLGIDPKGQQDVGGVATDTKPWPSTLNMVPNAMTRSALFGCARLTGDARNLVRERVLDAQDPYTVKYRGHDLDQNDCEVWELALAWCRQSGKPIGARVHFSFNDWCRVLERPLSDGKGNDNIIESLKRMMTSFLMVDLGNGDEPWIHLIREAGRAKGGRAYVAINPEVYEWLTHDLTEIDLKRKVKLRSDLSRWMHDYYSTSSSPFPTNLSTLLVRSGSNPDTPMSNFRVRVAKAVEELKQCDPPLFAPETRIAKKENGEYALFVVKATNSRIVPRKAAQALEPVVTTTTVATSTQPVVPATPTADSAPKATRFPTSGRKAKPSPSDDDPDFGKHYVAEWDRDIDPSDERSSDQRKWEWIRNRNRADDSWYPPARY